MAEAMIKFFLQRLESLLLQETETFSGLNDQIKSIKGSLREISGFFGVKGSNTQSDNAFCTWVNQLKNLVSAIDEQVDEFIIQMDKQIGSDRLSLTECFKSELQKIESHLADMIRIMKELDISTIIEEEKGEKEDNKEESHRKEGESHLADIIRRMKALDVSTITQEEKGEKEDSKEESHRKEGESHLADIIHRMKELDVSTITEEEKGEKEDNKEESHRKGGDRMELSSTFTAIEESKEENKSGKEEHAEQKDGQTLSSVATAIEESKEQNESDKEERAKQKDGQTSSAYSSVPFKLKYNNLPYYLQSCLMYCCLFPKNYYIHKGRLIRLLVAEGLIQEKTGQLLEDVAEENINELVSRRMLQVKDEHPGDGIKFTVSSPYHKLLHKNYITTQTNSDVTIPHTARHVLTSDTRKIGKNNLRPRSLFLFGNQNHIEGNWLDLTWTKFLRVLDLEETKIKSLPEEVGALIHLTYIGLKHCNINELPETLGRLQALQTLDIRWCGNLSAVSSEILSLVRLRHLKMFKSINVSGMKLPKGIGRLRNLLTLTGVHAGDGIAEELDKLTQLRRLGMMDITEENAGQLYASMMKMQGLLCLSLEAKYALEKQHLVLSESFSPPLLVRKLRLEGLLEKVPSWLGSMENLTKLRLGFSHLSENPTPVLQLLPNLKILTLWQAYDAKHLGKEFCKAGGFSKLEVLTIASHVLEDWTELEEGALPSLQYLHFHNCLSLRMLPEGLQSVTTLKQLKLLPLLDEHAERLKPDGGKENYKIRHIPKISFTTMAVLNSIVRDHPCYQTKETSEE